MKHKPLLPLLALLAALLMLGGLAVMAAYTPSGRELVSLGYLNQTFSAQVLKQADTILLRQEGDLMESAQARLDALEGSYDFRLKALEGKLEHSSSLSDRRYKKGDCLTLGTGATALLLAGEVQVSVPWGALVDATQGLPLEEGALLPVRHRCIAAENSTALLTVTSDTAVLSVDGAFDLSPSGQTDYNMLSDALKAMGLFKGSDTAYGSGFDLELPPTRIQGLIMFLRLIGEEQQALACTDDSPFTDLPPWCKSYVAYAYQKGYTNGVTSTQFAPSQQLRATEYLTFVLRALGYRDSGENPDFTWDTALPQALQFGVITAREHKMLTEQPFLRAQVAYVSYYALDARLKQTGRTLFSTLISSGALDGERARTARAAVTSVRMR